MVDLEEEIIDKDFRQSYWLALQFWVQPNRIFTVGVPQASHGINILAVIDQMSGSRRVHFVRRRWHIDSSSGLGRCSLMPSGSFTRHVSCRERGNFAMVFLSFIAEMKSNNNTRYKQINCRPDYILERIDIWCRFWKLRCFMTWPKYLKARIRVLHSQPTKWYEKFHLIYMKRLCITVGLEIA